MTRTQKLGLCTWLPEDPVCLAEVNDNFNRLDTSGARALRQAEAGLIALGGVMAAQAHQGGHTAYSDSIQADAFSDMEQVADYTGVYFLNQCGELLTEGVSDGTVFGNTADNAFNASGISRATQVTQTWVKLFSFYPDAYGTLSTLKLQSVATTGSTTTAVKLAIWDSATRESLLETELATMTRPREYRRFATPNCRSISPRSPDSSHSSRSCSWYTDRSTGLFPRRGPLMWISRSLQYLRFSLVRKIVSASTRAG